MRLLPLLSLSLASQPQSKELNMEPAGAPSIAPQGPAPLETKPHSLRVMGGQGRGNSGHTWHCCPSPRSPRDD